MDLLHKSFSLVGSKGTNQDCLLEPVNIHGDWWCAVADGVGESELGGVASRMCIDALRLCLESSKSMKEIFSFISNYLSLSTNSTDSDCKMSSTLSILRLFGNWAVVGHVGDSRITHYSGVYVMNRTQDQTEVQKLLDDGVISIHQARRYPRRNVILSAMSPSKPYDLFVNKFCVKRGDRILLTTDGFHDKLQNRSIVQISKNNQSFSTFFKSIRSEISTVALADDATCLALEIA